MTAVIVIAGGLLLGLGLVVSQLVRLREWLAKAPAAEVDEDTDPGEPSPTA